MNKKTTNWFKIYFFVFCNISCFLIILTSCNSNGGDKTSPEPLSKNKLYGSFESKYKRYQKSENPFLAPISKGQVTAWTDTVWRGERVHTQIIIWTEKETINNIKYKVSDLKNAENTISSNQIRLRFGQYVIGDRDAAFCDEVKTRENIYIADALSQKPITTVFKEDPIKLWLTVDIPENSHEGIYEGTIEITGSDATSVTLNISFFVLNRTLPKVADWKFHLDIWQFPFQLTYIINRNGGSVLPFSDEYFRIIKPFYAMLADAGQKTVTAYIKDGAFGKGETMVKWTKLSNGTWYFDYSDFDRYVQELFSLGIDKQINCFSIVGWNKTINYYDAATESEKNLNYLIGSTDFNNLWNIFLTDFRSHLQQKGWFEKVVLYMDEIKNEEMRAVINLIKGHDKAWKIGLAGGETTLDIENSLYDYSTILGFNRKSTNNTIATYYTSCAQTQPNNYVTVENNPAEMTWLGWYASSKGYNGFLRWALDYWQSNDPMNAQDGANSSGDFSFIYRSDNTANAKPVSSIRFEMLREGIQDYEKIRILSSDTQIANVLKAFTETSGKNAKPVVEKAQSLLKKMAIK